MMIRKLDTGAFVATADAKDEVPPNGLRPVDYDADKRAQDNKRAAFRKS